MSITDLGYIVLIVSTLLALAAISVFPEIIAARKAARRRRQSAIITSLPISKKEH